MRKLIVLVLVTVLGSPTAWFALAVPARAAEEKATAGVLLLRTGGVLQGEIEQVGDRYLVRGAKSQLDVAASQVALQCNSLEEAYREQRRQFARPTAESHLALADWCVRQNLFEPARRELADARAIDPRHPKLMLLERRLAVVAQSQVPKQTIADTDADAADDKHSDELRTLEAMAAELPSGVVERFTRKVQPLLVNNCTTSGCHQPSGNLDFQLDRAVLHGLSNRRTTLRNLSAALGLVNREQPALSRLLTMPLEAHGGRKPPLFGNRQTEHLEMLGEWVALVSGKSMSEVQLVSRELEATPPTKSEKSRTTAVANYTTPAAQMLIEKEAQSVFDGLPPVRNGMQATRAWEPKDEFDPEIFNRQFSNGTATPTKSIYDQRTIGSGVGRGK